MLSLPADPTDYYGTHRDPLRSFGGYAPNMPASAATVPAGRGRARLETSTQRRDYQPYCLPSPAESCSAKVFLGRSGFSSGKALHIPSALQVMRAERDKAAMFYSMKSGLSPDSCSVPYKEATETRERYRGGMSPVKPCGASNYASTWLESPGSRASGFTSRYSSVNPVYWRQHDPLMDQIGRNPPEIRSNAASVSQTDYRPYPTISYESAPVQGILKTRMTKGTGFPIAKELRPCFLPEPCVYGHSTPSYMGEPSRYNTSYNTDFQERSLIKDTNGCEIMGNRSNLRITAEESPDFSMGCGPPRDYITETREKYPNHWPLEGQRTFGLNFPVRQKAVSSGFVHSIKKHAARTNPCEGLDIYGFDDTSPQRYNPWPKFYLGHRTMVEKGYRPDPYTTGIDYAIATSLLTTGMNAEVFLY